MSEIPAHLYEKLMNGRTEWSRHGYLLVARAMVPIDEALDEYNEYRKSLEDFERVFENE